MSIRKELTAQNVLLGFQHVLVSNVWLDPVFVAGAIGLPIALSSNMINAIFIVSGLVTLVQATRLVRLPVVQGPSAAFDALMIAAGTAGMLGAASSSILIASLVFLVAVPDRCDRADAVPVLSDDFGRGHLYGSVSRCLVHAEASF